MRKQYLTYIASLAAAATLTACGSSPLADEPGGLSGIEQMELPVIMSVAPTAGDGGNIFDHGTQPTDPLLRAESAINPKSLYIATYTASDAKLIEVIYAAGEHPAGVTFFDHATWGPTFSFTLNKETHTEYASDFYIAAFSIPEMAKSGDFQTIPGNVLSDPRLKLDDSLKDKVWTLESDLENLTDGSVLIPMAGCERITTEWLEATYNRDIYGVAPLQLPAIRMTRAMAKIVIEDLDGIITSATCTHNAGGRLFPHALEGTNTGISSIWWSKDFNDIPAAFPNVDENLALNTQIKTAPDIAATEANEATGDPAKPAKYIFYAYEHDFTGKAANDAIRGLVTLTADGLPDKTIHISPYDNGKLSEKSYEAIQNADDGAWRGLLRNHCYTFSVSKPDNGELQIYVKTAIWTVEERELFDF